MRAIIPALAGSKWFVLDALRVQEVMGMRAWIPLPQATPGTPGVLAWRGRAVSVLDVGRFLDGGTPLRSGSPCARTLVAEAGACTVAIPVDAVREVHEVGPLALRTSGSGADLETEEILVGDVTMPLLDLEKVIARLIAGDPAEPAEAK
jgi:chemotaxis signal transduction protein